MYIQYTFVHFAILLIRQILGAVPLPVTLLFAIKALTPTKKPKVEPKPETECLHCKGNGHWKRKCPEYLVDKKDGKVNKGIFDIPVIDVCLTSVYSSP